MKYHVDLRFVLRFVVLVLLPPWRSWFSSASKSWSSSLAVPTSPNSPIWGTSTFLYRSFKQQVVKISTLSFNSRAESRVCRYFYLTCFIRLSPFRRSVFFFGPILEYVSTPWRCLDIVKLLRACDVDFFFVKLHLNFYILVRRAIYSELKTRVSTNYIHRGRLCGPDSDTHFHWIKFYHFTTRWMDL